MAEEITADKTTKYSTKIAIGAAAIVDVWKEGKTDWRLKIDDNEFLESYDWIMAVRLTTAVLKAIENPERTTGYVLWWRYSDGSGQDIVRVYTNPVRANEDWNLIQQDYSRNYYLSQVPLFGLINDVVE